jgi:hypothetical protein
LEREALLACGEIDAMGFARFAPSCAALLGLNFLAGCNGSAVLPSQPHSYAPQADGFHAGASGSGARLAAMHALAAVYEKLPHKSTLEDAKSLLSFIQKDRRQFSAAGIYDAQVWARFSDGNVLAIANAQLPSQTKPRAVAPRKIRVHCKSQAQAACPRAYVLGNRRFFSNSNDVAIAAALGAAGYGVVKGDVTVDQLKLVKNAHVLEIDSHGMAIGPDVVSSSSGDQGEFGVLTATPVTANDDVKYAGDIADGSILYGLGTYLAGKAKGYALLPVYVAMPKFFQKYVTFQNDALDDSLAFLNTCFSASPAAQQSLLKTLGAKGLGTYLGWAKEVNDHVAIIDSEIFYNRTLPEDVTQEVIPVPHLIPPEPAADVVTAYDWMVNLGITGGTGSASNLELFLFPPRHPQLAPILKRVSVTDDFYPSTPNTIEGIGEWGAPAHSGELVWGIAQTPTGPLAPFFPTPTYASALGIKSTIPANVSNGFVRVVEDGISSNAVPLTEWDGTISDTEKLTFGDGSPGSNASGTITFTAVLNVSLRADVNPYRTQISGPMKQPELLFSNFMSNSTGSLNGSGSRTVNGIVVTYAPTNESATVAPEYILPGTSSASFFLAQAPYGDPTAFGCDLASANPLTACVTVDLYGPNVATCTTTGGGCPAGSNSSPVPWQSTNTTLCGPQGTTIPFTVTGAYAMTAPVLNCPAFNPSLPYLPGVPVTETQTWTSSFGSPKSPPTSQTATGG